MEHFILWNPLFIEIRNTPPPPHQHKQKPPLGALECFCSLLAKTSLVQKVTYAET